jgi:bifunctional ADP-heptose synthase (sugar kinase/adenylyltransferase)
VIANFAAGVEVGKLGAQTVSGGEVLEAYGEWHERSTREAREEHE